MQLRHLVAAVALCVAFGLNVVAWATTRAQSNTNRAGLIVQFKDGSVLTRCVSFSEPTVSGYDLLRRARLPLIVEVGGMGVGVCKIGNDGCNFPQQSCFCACETLGVGCQHWIYFRRINDVWQYASLGASNTRLQNRDVDGWIWGSGRVEGAEVAPPLLTFDQICGAANVSAQTVSTAINTPPTTVPTPLPTVAQSEPLATVATAKVQVGVEDARATARLPSLPATASMQPTIVAAGATVSVSPTDAPTTRPMTSPTMQPVSNTGVNGTNAINSISNYVMFGAIAIALVVTLVVISRRGRS